MSQFDPIAARLERLEAETAQAHRAARRWRAATGGLVSLGLALVLMGQAPDKTVRGTRIVLEDAGGRERAALHMSGGKPHLTLFDAAGKPRMDLVTSDDGQGTIGLLDEAGKVRAAFGVTSSGHGSLLFKGPGDELRAALTLSNEGVPGFVMADPEGHPMISAGVSRGIPTIALKDANQKLRALLACEGPSSFLRFYDAEGKRTHQLPQ